ncbi:MAG: nicotinate-nucleotide diphosphorylase, partial [Acidiferrobacterales bacterium]
MLPIDIKEIVRQALAEDLGNGDLTAKLIPGNTQTNAHVITRDDAIMCGAAWFDEVFHQLDST